MKKRLTIKDIEMLTDEQIQSLSALWIPERFDVAVANICKDVTNEEYEKYEFVIGNVKVYNGIRMMLCDLTANETNIPGDADDEVPNNDSELNQSLEDSDQSDEECDETEELDEEVDFDFSYTRPSSFTKEECIPLLNIGQMMEILQKNNYGKGDFYFIASMNEIKCEMSKGAYDLDNYGADFESAELCDVLWESVKALL